MAKIEYRPMSVRGIMTEMKDITDVMIDLACAAVQFQSKDLAKQVLNLEAKMDELMYEIGILATVSVRNIDDGEKMTGILQVANAAKIISDATGGIVDPVLRGMDIHPVLQAALDEAEERTDSVRVAKKSALDGQKLSKLELPNIGVWILAIKRKGSWTIPVTKSRRVKAGSILVVRGPEDGIKMFREMAGAPERVQSSWKKLRRLREPLAGMRDMSCSMVDMAYSSVLFRSKDMAEEVRELEGRFDDLNYEIPLEVLRAAKREHDIKKLMSVLQFVKCMERISDGADAIADVVLRGVELHPVFVQALEDSDEQIAKVKVTRRSPLAGHTLGKLNPEVRTGADVFTIKRGDHYIFNPSGGTTVRAGDQLMIRGSELGIERMRKVAAGEAKLPETKD